MNNQINMFEIIGLDETPEIPFEEQKKGMKGWVIQIQGIYTVENGFKKNMVGVTTKRVVLKADSYTRKNRLLDRIEKWQNAECTGEYGCKGDGWVGSPRKLYTKRPTWRELQNYVKEHYKDPYDEIVFTYKDGNASVHIGDYYQKKALE